MRAENWCACLRRSNRLLRTVFEISLRLKRFLKTAARRCYRVGADAAASQPRKTRVYEVSPPNGPALYGIQPGIMPAELRSPGQTRASAPTRARTLRLLRCP